MKSRDRGIDPATGLPLGAAGKGCGRRAGGSVCDATVLDRVGAEAVDFGEAGTESAALLDLSDSVSEGGRSSPVAPSLFKIFLMSIHSLRPLQAGSPAPRARHQSLLLQKSFPCCNRRALTEGE